MNARKFNIPGPQVVASHDPDAPPAYDARAEKTVLGAVILDRKVLPRFSNLRPEYFFATEHCKIFNAMLALDARSEDVGDITLIDELRSRGELDSVGGEAYVAQLADGVAAINQASQAAEIIRRNFQQRAIIRVFTDGIAEAHQGDFENVTKHAESKLGALRQEFSEPLPEEIPRPDMPDAALDGRLGEFCGHLTQQYGFPLAYAWPALVTVAGTLVPPTPNVHTNLNCALVGKIGTGKTETIQNSIKMLGLVEPQLQPVMAGSGEGLFENLQDAKGEGRLISVDELVHLFIKVGLDKSSFAPLLNRAFSATEFDLILRRSRKVHVNCRLGIVGGVVETMFGNCFGAATTIGLYDRFVFGLIPKPHDKYSYRPFEGPFEKPDPCGVRIDPEVFEAMSDWKKEDQRLSEGRPVELAIRFAAIAAAFSGRSVLRAKDLGPARAFAEYQRRVRLVLQPNPGENSDAQCAFAITAALPTSGEWIREREVSKMIHAERFGPGIWRRAIENLEFNGTIERVRQGRQMVIRRAK